MARLGFLVAMAGCASAPPEPAARPAAGARLQIVNLTARSWDVTFTTPEGGSRKERVGAGEKLAVSAAAGASALDQTLLDPRGEPVATRRVAIRLNAGEMYTFPLATLADAADTPPVSAR